MTIENLITKLLEYAKLVITIWQLLMDFFFQNMSVWDLVWKISSQLS
jgi:hypothetical protein